MATVTMKKAGGGAGGSVELQPDVFDVRVRPDLIHAEVRRQLARRRAGTHATKGRSAVSGGGTKPYRQKGTGRARQGSIRAPQYAGGGTVFGPVPRRYEHKLPKRVRKAALVAALSQRQQEGAVSVVEALSLEAPKTRQLLGLLQGLEVDAGSLLIVVAERDRALELAARNLPRVDVIAAAGLNVYDVLRHRGLLFTGPALEAVHARLGGGAEEGSA